MITNPLFLEKFKKKTISQSSKVKSVFFMIASGNNGYFVQVVDQKLQKIEVNYLNFSGEIFNSLRIIQDIKDKNSFTINWELDSDHIYFADHEYLMHHLVRCPNLVNEKGEKLEFVEEHGAIRLIINENEGRCESKFVFIHGEATDEDFSFVTDTFIQKNHQLFEIQTIGSNYRLASYFKTSFVNKQVEQLLSIFFSNIENVEVTYNQYKIQFDNDVVTTFPILIFEKIDIDNALFMRVGQALPNIDKDFYEKFELTKVAEINEFDNVIHVKNIEQTGTEVYKEEVNKLVRKYAATKEQKDHLFVEDNLFVLPQEVAHNFIINELPSLLIKFTIFGAEKLKTYKIYAKTPKLKITIDHGIDFLEGDGELDFDGQKISIIDAINQFNKQNYIQLNDGVRTIINQSYIRKLERIFKKSKNKVSISFFDLPLIDELIGEKISNATFAKHREVFEGFNNLKSAKTQVPKVNAEMRNYQKQGFKWLDYLHTHKLGGCLADDMGLGKTLQAIALLSKIYPNEKMPTLIVMPKSLLFNWQNEITKFNPNLTCYCYYGNDRDFDEARKRHLIFTTYAMVRNDVEKFKNQEFYYVILDESQNIKNLNAQVTQAVMLLQAKHRLALSGTPIENNLSELYSLFRFLNPAMFGTISDFNHDYALPIQKNNDKDAICTLRKKIYPFILRRLKKDVLKELPDQIEQELFVEMSEDQKRLYDQRRAYYHEALKREIEINGIQKSQFLFFQALTELRQIASVPESKSNNTIASPKVEMLIEYVTDAVANDHKVIIFTNFIASIELIGEQLDKEGIDFVSMTGSTKDRQTLVDRFQNDVRCKVFLMTLKTGGVGLNLTAADTVFIFEPWWNRAAEMQGMNRAHRIGQTRKVMNYRIITKASIEEKILLLQQKKSELFENIIASDNASIKSLTESDIDFILG